MGLNLIRKRFKFEVKAVSDEGVFEGFAAGIGNSDSYDDIIEPGAFKRTIDQKKGAIPILFQHDSERPIGIGLEMVEKEFGLAVKGQLAMDVQLAQETRALMKIGALKGLSIGFRIPKNGSKQDGKVRRISEIDLVEYSVVTFPANTRAQVDNIKAIDEKADFAEVLEHYQTYALRYQMEDALCSSLSSIIYGDQSISEKLDHAQTSIDQFRDAYMEHLPKLLKLMGYKADEMHDLIRKVGRMLSAKNRASITAAIDNLQALLDADAASQEAAGRGPAEEKGDPENIHSLLTAMRGTFKLAA